MTIVPQDDISYQQCSKCPNSYPATDEFFDKYKMKSGEYRLRLVCKECRRARDTAYAKQYRQTETNKAYRKQHGAQYYQEHREERLDWQKQYHELRRDDRNAYSRQYRKDHPDLVREQEKRRREKHKDKIRERKKRWQQSANSKAYHRQYYQTHKDKHNQQTKQKYLDHRLERVLRQRQYGKTEQGRMVYRAHWHKRRAQKRASKGSYTPQQLQEQFQRQKGKCHYCKVKLGKVWHADHVIPLSRGGSNDISNIVAACPTCNMRKNDKLPHEWFEGGRLL